MLPSSTRAPWRTLTARSRTQNSWRRSSLARSGSRSTRGSVSRSRCAVRAADMVALRGVIAIASLVGAAALSGSAQMPIRGRVVADDTGEPIRNARVALDRKADPSAVLTDAEGHFALPAVGASQTLHASKTGYAASAAPVAAEGEIRLQRGGVITGRVLD